MFKNVLFPVDRSPEAKQAATTVAQLVRHCQSHLTLLSVVEQRTEDGPPVHPEQASPNAVADLLADLQSQFNGQGIDCDVLEESGQPAFTICDIADELDIDLIVMGCSSIGLTQEGQTESVTNRVINLAPCPVLVVP